MLTAMRDGANSKIIKFVLFGFLVMAVGGMAMADVGGFFRNGVGTNMVAKVGKESLTMTAFDQNLRRVLAQQGMQPREAYELGFVDQVLQSQINQSLLTQAAMEMGIYAGDDQVAKQISSLIDPLVKSQGDGSSRADMLRRLLQAQSMSEQEFISSMRQTMMNTVLQSTVKNASAVATRAEALNMYLVQNETRKVDGFFLPDASVKDAPAASETILKAFYDSAKSARYAIPETRSFTIAILTEDNVKSAMTISDEDIESEYKKSIAAYTLPERRVIEQAVLNDEDSAIKVAASVRDDKKSLKDAVKAITGKTSSYQDATTLSRQGLVKDIGDAAFTAQKGDLVDPIKTPLGWHVLVVKDVLPKSVKPLADVADELRKDLTQSRLSAELYSTANAVDDRLAGGEDITAIAKDMNMKMVTIGPVGSEGSTLDKHDALKDFEKDRAYILQTAFELNEGESAPVLELADGRYAALHLDKINPRDFKPFEDVKADIEQNWLRDQRASLNVDRSRKIQQEIESGSKTLVAAANEAGAKIENFASLKHNADAPASIGKGGYDAIFNAAEGETIVAAVPGGFMIATIRSVTLPDASKVTDKDLEPIMSNARRATEDEFMQAYVQYLNQKMKVRINRNLLNTMYGPESTGG
jgi:peptidyl-prolyl cis-trans isomerase D